jgi:hypothetical protein
VSAKRGLETQRLATAKRSCLELPIIPITTTLLPPSCNGIVASPNGSMREGMAGLVIELFEDEQGKGIPKNASTGSQPDSHEETSSRVGDGKGC